MPRAIAIALLSAAAARAQTEAGTLSLGVGQQKVIQIPHASRVAIGDPDIADARQVGGGDELLLTGVGEGRTSLLVWRGNRGRLSYAVVVRRQDPKDVVSEVRALLGEREGIRVRVVGDRVVLEGESIGADDEERVGRVTQLYPQVASFVRPSGSARKLAADALNKAFQRNGLRTVQAGVVGSTLLLEGWVESAEELKRVDLLARTAGEKVDSLVTVVKKMVLVEVDFVEVASGSNKLVGVKPPLHLVSTEGSGAQVAIRGPLPGLDASGATRSAEYSAQLGATTDFSAGARFDSGYARVLGRPRLVCASGEKAEFVAGGELPLVVATQNQFAVEWKKFGIVLSVTPTADRSGNIATDIYAEVSDVDRSISVRANGFEVPGFRLRDVKTSVTVKDGETVILSGLYSYNEDKEVSKVPLLGHIPILGELFKSRNFVERKTELAIYVTPRIVAPASPRVKEMIDGAQKQYRDAADSVSFSLFD